MGLKKRIEAARKELAALIAEPLFGKDANPSEVEVVLWDQKYGIRIAEFSRRVGDKESVYMRLESTLELGSSIAKLFLLCEEWLTSTVYEDPAESLPHLREAIQTWGDPDCMAPTCQLCATPRPATHFARQRRGTGKFRWRRLCTMHYEDLLRVTSDFQQEGPIYSLDRIF
jgi:hypothetical protein